MAKWKTGRFFFPSLFHRFTHLRRHLPEKKTEEVIREKFDSRNLRENAENRVPPPLLHDRPQTAAIKELFHRLFGIVPE